MQKNIILVIIIAVAGFFVYQNFIGSNSASGAVVIFTASNCPPCEDTKRFLDENEPDYIEYNIDDSEENYKRFEKYHINSLPLVIVGGEIIKDGDRTLLNIAINGLYEPGENSKTVVMYSKPRCGWCGKAREFLQNNDIEFSEYDITESSQAQQEFDRLGGYGTPLILVGDNKISGFNEKALKMALEQVDLL